VAGGGSGDQSANKINLGRINFDFYGQIGVRVNGYSKKSEI
jgi:hypothetical protein